jgi:ribosomal protein L7/L12
MPNPTPFQLGRDFDLLNHKGLVDQISHINHSALLEAAANLAANGNLYSGTIQQSFAKAAEIAPAPKWEDWELKVYSMSRVQEGYIEAIKLVRHHMGYGLKEAKDCVDLISNRTTADQLDIGKMTLEQKSFLNHFSDRFGINYYPSVGRDEQGYGFSLGTTEKPKAEPELRRVWVICLRDPDSPAPSMFHFVSMMAFSTQEKAYEYAQAQGFLSFTVTWVEVQA